MEKLNSPKIYIVAGEPSGDILGDKLIKTLQAKFNSPIFNGVGAVSYTHLTLPTKA